MARFRLESEMTKAAAAWLRAQELIARREFVTPWGICDLVGASLSKRRIGQRLRLGQTRALGSPARAQVLLSIPEQEEGYGISVRRLARACEMLLDEAAVERELERLVRERFVVEHRAGAFQRVNGWMPLQRRLVAVELKLKNIDEAFHQARSHLGFTPESYVGLPKSLAERTAGGPWAEHFRSEGVGLLAVDRAECRVLIRSAKRHDRIDQAVQMYVVEKFWRTWLKDRSA
jgi:hypothetical protein